MHVPNHVTRRARERFLADGAESVRGRLRDHIVTSWQRSHLSGAPTSIRQPAYQPQINPEHRLIRAASPVLDELAAEIQGEKFCVFLGDASSHILDRRVGEWMLQNQLDAVYAAEGFIYDESNLGTNGMGTAAEEGRAVHVLGAEHYAEELAEFTCVGVPIYNPFKGHVEGAIDLTCPVVGTSRLMMPLIRDAASEIQQRLYEQSTTTERFLLQQFLKWTKRSSHAVVALNESMMLSNPKAARLLSNTDQHLLWDHALEVMRHQRSSEREITLAHGETVSVDCRPLLSGGDAMGALLTIKESAFPPAAAVAELSADGQPLPGLVGQAPAWVRCIGEAQRHMGNRTPLLLHGEGGVGKLTLACALHEHANRLRPFVVCDAAELIDDPALVTEQLADGGTVVIRHLETLGVEGVQGLHGLVERWTAAMDTLVVATRTVWVPEPDTPDRQQQDAAIRTLGFAEVEVPPLRERRQDIPALVRALLVTVCQGSYRFTDEAMQLIARTELSGNVTELRTIVERSVAATRGWTVSEGDLPDDVRARAARRRFTLYERAELQALLYALREAEGNKKLAAQMLGISRSTLYRKMRSFGVGAQHLTF